MAHRARYLFALLVVVAILAAGCASDKRSASEPRVPSIFSDSTVAPLVLAMPAGTISPLPAARLAAGLIPPTNRWFSGLVYGNPSMPVYPLPLSFRLLGGGFQFGVPSVETTDSAITGSFFPAVSVHIASDSQLVTAYDTASVTISQRFGKAEVGRTVIAEGSPFVSFTASRRVRLGLGTPFATSVDGMATVDVSGSTYGLSTSGHLSRGGTSVSLSKGQSVTWFVVAHGSSVRAFSAAAKHPIVGTRLRYGAAGSRATTTITYETTAGPSTLFAAMPHQYQSLSRATACGPGHYDSIFGELKLCSGTELSWSVPTVQASGTLDLSALGGAEKNQLAAKVTEDIAATGASPDDTYFGGKWLYRSANLLDIARELGASTAADVVNRRLTAAISEWTDPAGCDERRIHCFVYDPRAKGIVGLAPSFGSDQFNDHHFHYGYFLYAAAVVASHSPALVKKWAPVMNLLAADIGTSGTSDFFPDRRVFDAYAGHSWAGGTGISADSNNQESSSEAVTAWDGLALWAKVSRQPALLAEASWMLSAEAASAKAYWTNFPLGAPAYKGFSHTITSLVWGGRRDYATFFSTEPSAMLGIQVLPMSPVADYLGGDSGRIRANLRDSAADGFAVLFGDELLMYSALQSPDAASSALVQASALPEGYIDNGDSRSYLLAWLMVHSLR